MEEILDGKYLVGTDSNQNVIIRSKDGGSIESQTVEATLLLEIIRLLKMAIDD